MPELPGLLPVLGNPPLGFRFGVVFMAGGVSPNSLDILFQKVSGIGSAVETQPVQEGGQNLYTQALPKKIQYENLELERGLLIGSPLAHEFDAAMALFKFKPASVLVSLYDQSRTPLASWLFHQAYPVRWRIGDLDATANSVVIEHLSLTYQRMQSIRL